MMTKTTTTIMTTTMTKTKTTMVMLKKMTIYFLRVLLLFEKAHKEKLNPRS